VRTSSSKKKKDPEVTTAYADSCQRCLDAGMKCVRTGTKEGAACELCKERKKKCEAPTDNANPQKNEIRKAAPLPKRALKSAAARVGSIRQPRTTPTESSPARSDLSEIIVVKPPPRVPTPPMLPRPAKRKREEKADSKARTTHPHRAYVQLPPTRVPGVIPELLASRLVGIERMQSSLNERHARMEATMERMEDILISWATADAA
jgi:hypothetical protein